MFKRFLCVAEQLGVCVEKLQGVSVRVEDLQSLSGNYSKVVLKTEVLSRVLPCSVLPCRIVYCPLLSSRAVLSRCPVALFSRAILFCPAVCPAQSWLVLSGHVKSCPALFMSCAILPCPVMACSSPLLSCPVLSCRRTKMLSCG